MERLLCGHPTAVEWVAWGLSRHMLKGACKVSLRRAHRPHVSDSGWGLRLSGCQPPGVQKVGPS